MADFGLRQAAVVFITSSVSMLILLSCHRQIRNRLPASIPRIHDQGKSRFSLHTRWKLYTDSDRLLQEAYQTYTKMGRTCIIPFIGFGEFVVLPETSLPWLGRQSEDTISSWSAAVQLLKARYTAPSVECIAMPWQGLLVKSQVKAAIGILVRQMGREIQHAFGARCGRDSAAWTTVSAPNAMEMIVSQLSSSFTINGPLCRDEQYLTDTVRFGKLVVIIAGILGHLPSILHPAIAPLLCLPIRQLERRTARKIRPILEQRLRAMEDNDIVVPEDRLQMMLRHAHAHVPQELNVKDITGRLINANFGAIHQTGYAATNVILDILGSDCEFDTIKIIREEVQETLLRHGEWNRTAFEEMVHTDSIIRESLRLHGFSSHIPRMVTAKDGVMTEDGFHIPRGTLISVMQRAPHLDETKFPDPKEYQPFRFSAQRTVSSTESSKPPALRVVNLSDSHMASGFGRHACPGRFIVDCEIKMIVAYMFMNYEVRLAAEHRGVRPPSLRRLGATFPPQHANIEIKARPQMQFPMTTE